MLLNLFLCLSEMANWLLRHAILLFWESWPKRCAQCKDSIFAVCTKLPQCEQNATKVLVKAVPGNWDVSTQARETVSHLHPQILADVSQQKTASHLEKVMASTSFTCSGVETEMCFVLSGGGRVHILLIEPQFLMLCYVLMHSLRAIHFSWAFYATN
jgi:hypothetical protein